jgi:hypothetical protein
LREAVAVHIPDFTLGSTLSEEQRAFFDAHGFIRFRGVASHEEIDGLLAALAALEAELLAEGRQKVLGTPLRFGSDPSGAPFIQRFAFASHYSPAISAFVRDPRFDAVRLFIGETARLGEVEKDGVVVNHWINEVGSRYRALGWHTDGLGVRLLPGTHTQGFFGMLLRKVYFLDNRPDPGEVALTARKGDLTIHDGRLWHRTAQATVTGAASRRRNLYMPYIAGPFSPKTEQTRTPLYHRLQRWVG